MKKSLLKMVKSFVRGGVCAFGILALASCGEDSGLGASVDTEAPAINITYPPVSAYIRDSFILYGTWDDDKGLNEISIKIENTTTKKSDFDLPVVVFKSDKTWSVELNAYDASNSSYINGWQFPDGKYQVTVTAIDKAGHSTPASRTFEIDNTAPVVVLKSPYSTEEYKPYGSSFEVNGTIADDHSIASLGVTIYDDNGTVLGDTEAVPYAEKNVATAGGTSVTLLRFSTNPVTPLQNRYKEIYGSTNKNDGTKKYSCVVYVADNAKKYTDPTEGENTTEGNKTTVSYLYDDVYESLMSANTGYDLSAADFMTIINGTYVASDDSTYDDNSDVVKGTLSTEELAAVKAKLVGASSVQTDSSKNHLKFSLNPAVNPTYTVSGLAFEEDDSGVLKTSPSGTKNQTVTFIVSPGLDGSLIKPATVKVWLLNCGATYDKTKIAEFVSNPASFAETDGVTLIRDFEAEGYNSGSVESLTETFKIPEVVANNYYAIAISGKDADQNDFYTDTMYGFLAALSGTPPTVSFTSPSSQAILLSSDQIQFRGNVTTTEVELEKLSLSIDVQDVESGTDLGTLTASSENDSITFTKTNYDEATGKYTYSWACVLSAATGYETYSAEVGSDRIYMYSSTITAEDTSGNKSTSSRTVTADTVEPKISINSVVPSVTNYKDSTHTDENAVYVNGTITVVGSINEMNLNNASYTVYVDGETVKNADGTDNPAYTDVAITSTQFKFTIDTTALADDKPFDIKITAHDRAKTAEQAATISTSLDGVEGNVGTVSISSILTEAQGDSFHILQETDRPVVTPTNADTGITDSQGIKTAVQNKAVATNIFVSGGALTATITDDDGVGSCKVEYSSDGTTYTEFDAGAISYSSSNNTLTARLPEEYGEYHIRITVTDTIGLETGKKSVDFYVAIDDGAPTFTSVQPSDGNFYNDTFTASGTIKDSSKDVSLGLKDGANGTLNNADDATGTSAYVGGNSQVATGVRFSDTIKVPNTSGDYTLTYIATDKYGQAKEYPILYTVDKDAPLFTNFAGLTDNGDLSTNSPSISLDAYDALSGVSKVSVVSVKTVDDGNGGTTTVEEEITTLAANGEKTIDSKKYTTYAGIVSLAEGLNTVYVKVEDKAGNSVSTTQYTVTVDTVAPTIASEQLSTTLINKTQYDALATASGITVSATLKDSGTGVKKAWLSTSATGATYDATATALRTERTATTDDWSLSLTIPKSVFTESSAAKDGQYTYYLYAQDAAGRTTVSSALTFVIDTTAPDVNVFVLADGKSFTQNDVDNKVTDSNGNVTSATYTLSGTWKDVQTGTKKLEYVLSDNPAENATWTTIDTTEAPNVLLSWTKEVTIAETSSWAISFRATDGAGNVSAVKTYKNIKFDYNVPVITRPSTIATQTKSAVSIEGAVTDTLGIAVNNIEIKAVKGSSTITATPTATTDGKAYSYTLEIPATEANNGTWTISFAATDNAGQKTTLTDVSVTLDNIAPTLSDISATSSAGTVEGTGTSAITYFNGEKPLTLSIGATDNTGGVGLDSVEYNIVSGHVASLPETPTLLNTNWTSLAKSGTSNTWKATIVSDFANLADGNYTIFVRSSDTLGNATTPVGVKVVNDKVAPVFTETTPTDETVAYVDNVTTTYTFSGTVNSTEGNFKELTYSLNSTVEETTTTSTGTLTPDASSGAWQKTQTIDNTKGGTFAYVFTAKDKAGNTSSIKRTVSQDLTPPTLEIGGLTGKADFDTSATEKNSDTNSVKDKTLTFTGTASDETKFSKITFYYVEFGKEDAEANRKDIKTGTATTWDITFNNIPDGWYTLYAVAEDAAGNKTSKSVVFGVDGDAPTSTLSLTAEKVKAMSGMQSADLDADGKYTINSKNYQAAWGDGITYIASETFTIGGTVTDKFGFKASLAESVKLYIGNTSSDAKEITLGNESTGSDGSKSVAWSYEQTVDASDSHTTDGTITYILVTTDGAGNSEQYQFIVHIDTQGPEISINSPVDGDGITTAGALSLAFIADDSGTGVSSVTYTIERKETEDATPESLVTSAVATKENGKRWIASYTIPEDKQGQLFITAKSKDYLGHEAESTQVKFYYDNQGPNVTDTKITTSLKTKSGDTTYANYDTNSIDITTTVTDAISGIETVTYKLDSNGTSRAMTMAANGSTAAGGTATYTATVNCEDGPHTITVIATDKFGNKQEMPISSFIVDTVKPVFRDITIEGASNLTTNATNAATTFSGSVEEATSSIVSFTVAATRIDDSHATATTVDLPFTAPTLNENNAFSFTLPDSAAEGTWEFTITAIDAAGNEQTATTGILLDKTAPEFFSATNDDTYSPKVGSNIYSAEKWYKDTTLNITGYFQEAAKKVGSGIAKIEYHRSTETENSWHVIDMSGTNGYVKFKDEISSITNGSTIQFRATDEAGNTGSGSLSFKIDETAPEVSEYTDTATNTTYSFTSYEGGQINGTANKTLKFLVYDKDSKLKTESISITVNKKTAGAGELVSIESETTSTPVTKDGVEVKDSSGNTVYYDLVTVEIKGTTEKTTESLLYNATGTLGVTCNLQDNAGNSWTGTIATLSIDSEAPSVKINSITPTVSENAKTNVNKTIIVSGTATDGSSIKEITLVATANGVSKTYTLNSDDSALKITYVSDTNTWSALIDTTQFYSDATGSADLALTVKATDVAENTTTDANAAKRTVTIDQNTDRPLVKITNFTKLFDDSLVLKYATNAEVTGSITDDDNSSTAIVKGLYVAKSAITSVANGTGWTTTTNGDTFTATHADYGTTTLTLSSGDWTYTPATSDQADGGYALYFYILDNADTVFTSAGSTQLEQPYWQFKSDSATKTGVDSAISYRVDGTSPSVKAAVAYSYSANDGSDANSYLRDDQTGTAVSETVGTSLVVGGTKKNYVKFVIDANDANGVASMTLALSQNDTDIVTLSSANVADGSISTTQNGSSNAVWTTKLIDMSQFATGEVKLTIVPVDNCSLPGNAGYSFSVDRTGPAIKVTTPRVSDEQNGTVTVSGTTTDVGNSSVDSIQFVIPPKNTAVSNAASLDYAGNLSTTASASAWSFVYDNSANGNPNLTNFIDRTNGDSSVQTYAVTLKSGAISSSTDIWDIPIWFKATDEIGNTSYCTDYTLRYNPNADMPVTTIVYPSKGDYQDPMSDTSYAVIGGTIRVNGSAAIESTEVSVGEVFLQIADMTGKTDASTADWTSTAIATKDEQTVINSADGVITYLSENKDISVTSILNADFSTWWGIATTTKSGSWSINLNANEKLKPTSSGTTTDIAIRACAVNSAGKMGSWSEPTIIHIDADAPIPTYKLKQFKSGSTISPSTTANAEKAYNAGMYLRNPNGDWYMEVYMEDTTGINQDTITVSGSAKKTDCTIVPKTSGSVTNYYIYVPIGKLTETSFSVSATDNDQGEKHTTTVSYKLYIDNDAPTMGALTETSTKAQIAYTKLKNSNYNVSLSSTATDSVSGFNMLAYFFKRTGTTTTIELPVKTKTSGNNEKAFWTKAPSPAVMTLANEAPSISTSGSAGTTVGLNSSDSDDSSGLYGVILTGATRTSTTFEHARVSDYVSKGVIAVGSLMRIGGNYVVITSIDTDKVTFATEVSTTYTDAFFAMAFIVDHASETSTWSGGTNTLESDDGDGIYEKLQTSAWTSEFCSDGLEDGPISVMCSAFDVAENVATQETKVMIANNTPRVTKVFLATDLNGDNKFAANEFVNGPVYLSRTTDTADAASTSYLSALSTASEKSTSIVTVGAMGDWSDSNNKGTLTDKLYRISGNSLVAFEFVSGKEGYGKGNNAITAYLSVGTDALSEPDGIVDHDIGSIAELSSNSNVSYSAAKAEGIRGIELASTRFNSNNTTNGKVETYGTYTESTYDTTNKKAKDVAQVLSLTLWDKTNGTSVGTADSNIGESSVTFGSQYTVVNIPVYFDLVDDRKPVPVIKNPTALTPATGHVELGSTLPTDTFKTTTTTGEYDRDTKISGKVVFIGTVSDEKKIASINLKNNGKSLGSGDNSKITATKTTLATFANGLLSVTSAASADSAWKFEINETTAAEQFSITNGHTITWKLTIDSSYINNTADKDVLFTLTANDGTNSDTATYQVDIVPYITRVTRAATGTIATGGDGTENINRSKLGHYPVSQGETLTVEGFNLAGVTVTVGSSTVSGATTSDGVTTFSVPARSGKLKVTVKETNMESLNNVNGNPTITDNVAAEGNYDNNLENYKMKGSSQLYYATDDRYLEVWNLGNYFKNTDGGADVSKPVMTADKNGNLYASWVAQSNSIVAFSYGMTNDYTPIFRCYDQPAVLNSIAFDTKGTSGAASVGFMPEHQGQSGSFSANAMSDTKIIGGVGAISIPSSYITANNGAGTVLSGTAITVTGNPAFKVDSANSTAYYSLASYDMNRRLGSYTNPRSARFGDFLHTIWYDESTESIKYSVVNTSQKDDFNQNGGAIAGWVLIDGGWTGQDRVHDWTKVNTGYANNTLSSSTNSDEHSSMGTGGGTYANYLKDIFVPGGGTKATNISALTTSSGYTLLYGVNNGVANAIEIGDSVALLNNNTGSYAITITSISAIQGANGYQVKFKDAPSHAVTAATVYQGNMNVVGGNAVRNINNFTPATNQSSSAGSSADMDVDSNGRPVIAYLDSTNSTLRVARLNTTVTPTTNTNASDIKTSLDAMKLAGNWTRTVVTNTTCSGEVSMRIDGADNIHILYQDQDGNLCYIFGTPNGNTYTFKAPETVDTTGTMSYGSISIKEVTAGTTTTYIPVASYLNKAGTAQGLKYAYRTSAPTAGGTFSADNWDYMILPAISSSTHYPVNENRVSLEARKSGWTEGSKTGILTNGGSDVTPKTVQAAVAFKSKQFETAYLLTE